MAEYIKREEAINLLWLYADESCASIVSDFESLPAADVAEVRHGRWLDKGWDGDFSWQIDGRGSCWRVYECSECQCKTSAKTDYCPNCGTRMDKKEKNHEIS